MSPRPADGTIRERRPDTWEVRVYLGAHPVSGRPRQRSVTVHGDLAAAQQVQEQLAAQATQWRAEDRQPPRTVGELLTRWISSEHDGKPSPWENYRQAARRLRDQPLARRAPLTVSPPVLHAAMRSWTAAGIPSTTVALHVRTLRAAFGWAFDQRLLAAQPLAGMHGPAQPEPRRDVPIDTVRLLLHAARGDVTAAAGRVGNTTGDRRECDRALHRAEQVHLLLRLAADTGARRGELAALRADDLHGRLLHIERGVSAGVVTTTKTGRSLTLGAGTTALWTDTLHTWQQRLPPGRRLGPWLFCARADHQRRLRTETLSHWFTEFVRRHGHPDVCLHRLRHTVASYMVARRVASNATAGGIRRIA